MLKHILHATDLSDASSISLNKTQSLMQSTGAKVTLLHCIEDKHDELIRFIFKTSEDAEAQWLSRAQSDLTQRKQAFGSQDRVFTQIEKGKVADCVARVATDRHADLIVTGASEKSVLRHTFLGSNALKVLRQSTCPVLVVKKACQGQYQRILIGIDLSHEISNTLHYLKRMAPEAEIVLAHCYEIPFESKLDHYADYQDIHLMEYRQAIRDQALKRMQVITKHLATDPLKLTTIVTQGEPADTLLQLAQDQQCDLIVLNKNNLTTLDSWILGSVTNQIINESVLDILIIDQSNLKHRLE